MKIGIDARFLTHPQSGGFKTYTENIVEGLSALDRRNDYVLYTDRPGAEERWNRENFRVKVVGGPAPVREQITLPLAMLRDRIEVAHFPCNTAPVMTKCKTVMTIHDLIPLMPEFSARQDQGRNHKMLTRYWSTVMPITARRADHVITISQASKSDIRRMLKVPEDRISVVPTGLHPDFRPTDSPDILMSVRQKYKLPERFIMGFASSDPRKNLQTLLRAVQRVSSAIDGIGLVLICASPEAVKMVFSLSGSCSGWICNPARMGSRGIFNPESSTLTDHPGSQIPQPPFREGLQIPPERGLHSGLVTLESVPRDDLVAIYNLAEVLAFPSLYEGFGLPVVEAMACGTPVVTSDISSLPEVAGDAALTVDPMDSDAIAAALTRILTEKSLRMWLVELGSKRVGDFSWQRTARETLAVYEKIGQSVESRISVEAAGGGVV